MNQQLITRDIICSDFVCHSQDRSFSRDDIIDAIRYWKIILYETHGMRRGMSLGLGLLEVDFYHIALIFAAAELGLRFIQLDHPVSNETMHNTKAAMYAPIDLGVVDSYFKKNKLLMDMMKLYCVKLCDTQEFDTNQIQNNSLYDTIKDQYFCQENDILFLASTSGTTSQSKSVPFTHSYTYQLSDRNGKLYHHDDYPTALHIRNMHHASSLVMHFLPTIMYCKNHYGQYVNTASEDSIINLVNLIQNKEINFIQICNKYEYDNIVKVLDKKNIKFKHHVDLSISGFVLTDDLLPALKKHNMNIVSAFGSVDTAIPLFINVIGPDTQSILPGLIGTMPNDGFYKIEIADAGIDIECPTAWQNKKTLQDHVEERDGLYFHKNRTTEITINNFTFELNQLSEFVKTVVNGADLNVVVDKENDCLYLAIWDTDDSIVTSAMGVSTIDLALSMSTALSGCTFKKIENLSKKRFTIDTKVSVDQLRGHFQNVVKSEGTQ